MFKNIGPKFYLTKCCNNEITTFNLLNKIFNLKFLSYISLKFHLHTYQVYYIKHPKLKNSIHPAFKTINYSMASTYFFLTKNKPELFGYFLYRIVVLNCLHLFVCMFKCQVWMNNFPLRPIKVDIESGLVFLEVDWTFFYLFVEDQLHPLKM